MSGLFWPGDQRAGGTFGDAALVAAMTAVESAWWQALVAQGIAPGAGGDDPIAGSPPPTAAELAGLAEVAEAGGNPVIGFVAWLRDRVRARDPGAARWLHRGLTSQDVLDTGLMLLARELAADLGAAVDRQVAALAALADEHRATPMLGRTLTQPAVPITFGGKVATWLDGLLDAAAGLDALSFPAQFGGAAGNRSGATALGADPAKLAAAAAGRLGLAERGPWHTNRSPVTRLGDALTGCTAAWGRIANDVLTLSRPEIGELTEPAAPGRGGSSAMPQKINPVLSVLLRRAALAAPAYASVLHLAAADTGDERPAGAWHLEWEPLRLLARHTRTAAGQATELIEGVGVHARRMAATLDAHREDVAAEARSLARLAGRSGADTYGPETSGADDALVAAAVARGRARLGT